MDIKHYPDNSSYAVINKQVRDITFKLNSYEDLWHLNQIVDAINNLGGTPTITIPCLIDQQADRRFEPNHSFGLKLVCKFLTQINAHFRIFHPHNPEVVEALMDNVEIIDNSEFIFEVIRKLYDKSVYHVVSLAGQRYELANKYDFSNLILMSSDAGGFKPLMKLCDKLNWQGETASASKYREYKDGKSILTQLIAHNDFRGKDIIIIDDICVYGGTFKGLSKLLKERNCGKLYLAVSHMTVEDLGEDPVTNYFDKVFTTNSKHDNYFVRDSRAGGKQPYNLEIIKMF